MGTIMMVLYWEYSFGVNLILTQFQVKRLFDEGSNLVSCKRFVLYIGRGIVIEQSHVLHTFHFHV